MLVSVELTVRIDEKVIKTNQVFSITPENYYKWERMSNKLLPVEIEKYNLSYLFEELKIIFV